LKTHTHKKKKKKINKRERKEKRVRKKTRAGFFIGKERGVNKTVLCQGRGLVTREKRYEKDGNLRGVGRRSNWGSESLWGGKGK